MPMMRNFSLSMGVLMILFVAQVACTPNAVSQPYITSEVTVFPTVAPQHTATPKPQMQVWRGSPTDYNFDPKWVIEFQFSPGDWDLVTGIPYRKFDKLTNRKLTDCTLYGGSKATEFGSAYRIDRLKKMLGATQYELNKAVRVKDNFVELVNYCANKDIANALLCYELHPGDHADECMLATEQVLGTMRLLKP